MFAGISSAAFKVFDLLALAVAFAALILTPEYNMQAAAAALAAIDSHVLQVISGRPLSIREFFSMHVTLQNVFLFFAFLLLWHGSLTALGVYTSHRFTRFGRREAFGFASVTISSSIIVWALSPAAQWSTATAAHLTLVGVAACITSLTARLAVRELGRLARTSQRRLRHVIIVGTNARAIALARRIQLNSQWGLHVAGFVDQHWDGEERFRESGFTIVSDLDGFQTFLKDHVVDEVIICTPLRSMYEWSSRIFSQCEQQGITVRYGSELFTRTIGHSRVEQFGGEPILTMEAVRQKGLRLIIKRAIDISAALILLTVGLPIMLATAVAIKLDSRGPVFFVQERIGLNKRRFRLYKFRTMVADAERHLRELEHRNELTGPVFKIKHDPRVTRIGAFLRKTSIDELPQLFNVLKGDMSMVGPRPLALRDYGGITEDWHRRRLSVRPGITCIWQVQGRNTIPFDRWMELDLEYIDSWSLLLDFKLMVKTIPAVLSGTGAS